MMKPKIVAHRGGAALYSENTLSAFQNAIRLGADEVECDVHLLKDGTVCIFHDFNLDQLAGQNGMIETLEDQQRRALVVSGSNETPPTLEQLADLLAPTDVRLHLEIKTNGNPRRELLLAERSLAILREKNLLDQTSAISFDPNSLVPFIEAGIPSGPCVEDPSLFHGGSLDDQLQSWKDSGYRDLSLNGSRTPRAFLDKANDAGFIVGVWTVNGPARLSYWLKQPVHYITSDQPDLALKLRDKTNASFA